jgi:hypothetical protein
MQKISRRSLFGGVAALIAAPAIVRVASLMPVKAYGQSYIIRPMNFIHGEISPLLDLRPGAITWLQYPDPDLPPAYYGFDIFEAPPNPPRVRVHGEWRT